MYSLLFLPEEQTPPGLLLHFWAESGNSESCTAQGLGYRISAQAQSAVLLSPGRPCVCLSWWSSCTEQIAQHKQPVHQWVAMSRESRKKPPLLSGMNLLTRTSYGVWDWGWNWRQNGCPSCLLKFLKVSWVQTFLHYLLPASCTIPLNAFLIDFFLNCWQCF